MLAGSNVKASVDVCFQTRGEYTLANCSTLAQVGVNAADLNKGTHVLSVNITSAGQITATGAATVDNATFILTATKTGNTLTWEDTGSSCIAAGLC